MNIIGQGQDLGIDKISLEYFALINPIQKGQTDPHSITYKNNETIIYQKANSLIAIFDLKLSEILNKPDIDEKFKKILKIIFNKNAKHKFLKKIICGKPEELRKFIDIFEKFKIKFKNEDNTLTPEGVIIGSIFNYSKLALPCNTWIGNRLKIKACPYCNAQYTVALEDSAKFQLDHFFPQSEYPYLALSFFNLIPSCANCNLKKKAKDTYKNFLLIHPYEESFHAIAKFETNEKIIEDFIKTGKFESEDFKISLVPKSTKNEDIEKIENHKKIFELEEKANVHKDVVSEIYMKAYIYCDSMKTELAKSFITTIGEEKLSLFNENEIDRIVFGTYIKEEDFHKRPLSKLTHDIAEELGLI